MARFAKAFPVGVIWSVGRRVRGDSCQVASAYSYCCACHVHNITADDQTSAAGERERPPSRLQPCMNWMDGRNGFCFLLSCPAPVPRCCHGPGVGLSESSGRWDEGLRGPRPPCCAAPSLPTPAGVRQCCFDVSAVKPVSGWPPSGPSPCSAPSRPLAFG